LEKFNIIYADPPWTYRQGGNGSAKKHYPLMPIEEICALPVAELAAKDSTLFLWATLPLLPEAFEAIRAWGFTYKTAAFVWVKTNKSNPGYFVGMGHWTRANAEICLLAIRGKPRRQAKNIPQIIAEPRREHSRKPAVARERIVRLMGDLPRVELFAREAPPGWAVWGNEVESTISL
jgi:N6-adenosine-specific RNA methylase IME4